MMQNEHGGEDSTIEVIVLRLGETSLSAAKAFEESQATAAVHSEGGIARNIPHTFARPIVEQANHCLEVRFETSGKRRRSLCTPPVY
ncbi:MAG: hypothetical protein GY811_17355 [Myxococcales bacterium]|nr:hypothetical protein [Myxococcales bacterium]